MSAPVMPLWVDSYLAATTDLTATEHGAYIVLLMTAWKSDGWLPNDDKRLARIARVTRKQWSRMKENVLRTWDVEDDGIFPRLLDEFDDLSRRLERRPPIPAAIRRAVFERDGEQCSYCRTEEGPFHLDHCIPWSRGGDHSINNLVVACASCNLRKGDRTDGEFHLAGFQ